jgi:hypothetical protein
LGNCITDQCTFFYIFAQRSKLTVGSKFGTLSFLSIREKHLSLAGCKKFATRIDIFGTLSAIDPDLLTRFCFNWLQMWRYL